MGHLTLILITRQTVNNIFLNPKFVIQNGGLIIIYNAKPRLSGCRFILRTILKTAVSFFFL